MWMECQQNDSLANGHLSPSSANSRSAPMCIPPPDSCRATSLSCWLSWCSRNLTKALIFVPTTDPQGQYWH